jgi:hypothetical protein
MAVVVGAVLRFATLDGQSFWLDEAYTVRLLDQPLGDMLRDLPDQESAPPLYYLLAWVWGHVLGFGEVGLRSLSALVGTLVIPVAYAAATRLAGRRAGVVAAALVAVHPLLVWFSQEARAYALVTLLAALSLVGFLRVLDRPDGGAWAAWAVPAALALATHYYAGFLVLGEAAWLVWRSPRDGRMALAMGGVAATAAALLPLALAQRSTGNTAYIGEGSVSTRLVQVPKQLLTGYASPGQALTTALLAVLVVVAAARLATVRDRARRGRVLVVAGLGLTAILLPVSSSSRGWTTSTAATSSRHSPSCSSRWPAASPCPAPAWRAGPWPRRPAPCCSPWCCWWPAATSTAATTGAGSRPPSARGPRAARWWSARARAGSRWASTTAV